MDVNMDMFNVDILDIDYGTVDSLDEPSSTVTSIADALIASKNDCGDVNVEYMKSVFPELTLHSLYELRNDGAIFQDPEYFMDGTTYDPWEAWVLRENYLSGFISDKLKTAEMMNTKYRGCFEQNISALKSLLPASLTLDEIHVSLGASWVSSEIYEEFIYHLVRNRYPVSVHYNKETGQWFFDYSKEAKAELRNSVLNNYTYGSKTHRSDSYGNSEEGMTAVEIIRQTMNAHTVKVYDYIYHYGYARDEYERVLNRPATLAAQEKQKLIIAKFEEWIHSDESISSKLQECYNDTFVGYAFSPYDGSFLKFSDMNPEVTLFPHQKNAIARILLSRNNVLLAHDVGTGKTYEIIAGIHELKRTGLSHKNMIVVPNNVLKSTVDAHKYLYPNDKILAVFPSDFAPAYRKEVLEQIKTGDYVAIYMAYSSFDMICMSKDHWIAKMTNEINELKAAAANTPYDAEKHSLEANIKSLSKKLSKYVLEAEQTPWETFDHLGINTLVVDEAHNYKNIPLYSKTDNIVGMHPVGSKKCTEMFEKARFCDRLIFATGTPLTNSLADLFVLQSYLQPEELRFREIDRFDMWINCFGERETNFEIDVDSSGLRPVTRFSTFHNLTELMCLFATVCDFHHTDETDTNLPDFSGYTDVCVPKSELQAEYIHELSERTELIRAHKVKRDEDNLLRITTDGRKCALDIRLVGIYDYDTSKSKTDECAEQILSIYRKYPGTCQAVFCDIGTPKSSFNVYDSLRSRLISLGIPEFEIAFVHDAESEKKRADLFRKMNAGLIRIVIGSTAKLGIGVNVQERLVAIHHLSVPWRPADMVQREGRIIRRGNTCEEVFIYRYITEGSFDSYSWQLLENKQRFISSFLSGTSAERQMDDISDAVLSYAEVKALAIGNPLIKKRVETANRLERTKMASRQRQKQLIDLRSVIENTPEKVENTSKLIGIVKLDTALYAAKKEPVPMAERTAFGEELLEAVKSNVLKASERLFDTYQGFSIMLPANMTEEHPYIYVRSTNGGVYYVDMGGDSPLGCSKRIDYLLDHFEDKLQSLSEQLDETINRQKEAEADLEGGNPYLEQITALTEELADIDKKLTESEDKAS